MTLNCPDDLRAAPGACRLPPVGMASLLILAVLLWCGSGPVNTPDTMNAPVVAQSRSDPQPSTATVRLASGEWPPYTGSRLPNYGCDSQVVAEVFALAGIDVTFGFFPWARAFANSLSRHWDGTLEWADTPRHRQTHYISAECISTQAWVFFHRREDAFDWNSLADLDGKVVGVTIGYAYSDLFLSAKSSGRIIFDEAPNDELNFRKLLAGRIDVFPMERRVGKAIMARIFSDAQRARITEHPRPVEVFKSYLLLSRTDPLNRQRMEMFNRGLRRLRENGRYAEIMAHCAP